MSSSTSNLADKDAFENTIANQCQYFMSSMITVVVISTVFLISVNNVLRQCKEGLIENIIKKYTKIGLKFMKIRKD